MKLIFRFLFCLLYLIIFGVSYGQKIYDASITDEEATFYLFRKREFMGYTKLETYNCQSTVYVSNSCKCVESKTFDTAGNLKVLILGDDIKQNQIDCIMRQTAISDSSITLQIEYSSAHLEKKLPYITLDNAEESKLSKINSEMQFDSLEAMPKKVIHYSLSGKPLSVYYPWGTRKPLKEEKDTLITEFGRIVSLHQYFAENEYHMTLIYDNENKLTDEITVNQWSSDNYTDKNYSPKFDTSAIIPGYGFTKNIYLYDSLNNLSMVLHTSKKNQLESLDRFYYHQGKLVKATRYCNSKGLNCFEEELYDGQRNLVEERRGTSISKHYYKGRFKVKSFFYEKNKFDYSTFYFYK